MPECTICNSNNIEHSTECVGCKKSWCNECAINLGSASFEETIIIRTTCPYCREVNIVKTFKNDETIAMSIMKKEFKSLDDENTAMKIQLDTLFTNIEAVKRDFGVLVT